MPSDVLLAVGVAIASLLSLWLHAPGLANPVETPGVHPAPDLAASVQVTLACATLAWRRRAPGVVLVASVLLTEAVYAEHYPVLALPYAVLVAVYTVAQAWPRRWSLVALAGTLAAMTGGALLFISPGLDDEPLTNLLAIVSVWALGHGVRLRQAESSLLSERARLLEDHARHLADEQQTLSQLAVERERATIARELHDIVANNVSVIVAWAAAGRRRRPDAVDPDTLLAIEGLGRETLGDVRGLVGVLHSGLGRDRPRDSPRLDRLPVLVNTVVAVGTAATLEVTGTPRELPAAVELNAYRIVQESLTNTMTHAKGSHVEVLVDYGERTLRLRVRDHGGVGTTPDRPGSGLFGMRQRVALLGGSFTAGPVPGEPGFLVEAKIPLAPEARR